jgi:hypothetical protein
MHDLKKTLSMTMQCSTGPGPELIKLLYPVKHGKPSTALDSNSNGARLFECNDCNVFMPGLPLEDTQIALVKQGGSGECLGCERIDKEDEAINWAGEFIVTTRFQAFLEQADPNASLIS